MANDAPDEVQRWTAKRQAALVVSILKGETSVQQAAEPHHSLGHVPALASGTSSLLAPGADGGVLAEIIVRETARNSTASGSSTGTHSIVYTNAEKNYQRPGNTADSGQLCMSENSPVA
jgi:hypothetical protein